MLRFYDDEVDNAWRRFRTLGYGLAGVTLALTALFWIIWSDWSHAVIVVAAGVFVALYMPIRLLTIRQRMSGKPIRYLILDLLSNSGKFLFFIPLVLLIGTPLPIQWIFIVGACALGIVLLIEFLSDASLKGASKESLASFIRYGVPLSIAQFLIMANSAIDLVLVEKLLSLDEVGRYGVMNSVMDRSIRLIPNALVLASWPYLVKVFDKQGPLEAARVFGEHRKLYALSMLVILAGVMLVGQPVLRVLLDSQYHPAIEIMMPMSIAAAFFGYSNYSTNVYNLKKRSEFVPVLIFGIIVVKVILALYLIPSYGIKGCAVANLIANSTAAVFLTIHAKAFLLNE